MVKVIIDKERIRDMLFVCGVKELKIIISLIREKITKMSNKINDIIIMYENDPFLKDAISTINSWYETKEEIDNLI